MYETNGVRHGPARSATEGCCTDRPLQNRAIPSSLGNVDDAISTLGIKIGELEDRLRAIRCEKPKCEASCNNAPPCPAPMSSGMQIHIQHQFLQIMALNERVVALLDEIEI